MGKLPLYAQHFILLWHDQVIINPNTHIYAVILLMMLRLYLWAAGDYNLVCFATWLKNTKKVKQQKTLHNNFVLLIVELSNLGHMKTSWNQSCSPIINEIHNVTIYILCPIGCAFWFVSLFLWFLYPVVKLTYLWSLQPHDIVINTFVLSIN